MQPLDWSRVQDLIFFCLFHAFSSISCNLQTVRNPPGQQTVASFSTIQLPLQKLLFSATMTHSPEKLAPLQLYQPMLFTVMGNVNQRDQRVSSSGIWQFILTVLK